MDSLKKNGFANHSDYSKLKKICEEDLMSRSVELSMKPPHVVSAVELLSMELTETPMLIPGLLPKKGLVLLAGGSDLGKSYFLLFLSLAVSSPLRELLGKPLNATTKGAIMVCTEESIEGISIRVKKLKISDTINSEKARFIFETEDLIGRLRRELERMPAGIVVIDTFSDLFGGNINDSIEVRKFFKPYKELAEEFGILIIFNHHLSKQGERNPSPTKSSILGSQALESACRTVLFMSRGAGNSRVLTVVKGNYIGDEQKNKGIVLSFDPETGFQSLSQDREYSADSNFPVKEENTIDAEVLKLYNGGHSYREITKVLEEKGMSVGKTKVGEIIKKHRPVVRNPSDSDGRTNDSNSTNN